MALSFRSPRIWDNNFSLTGTLQDGSSVHADYTTTTKRLKAHLVLVIDVSRSMIGAPLAAVVREVDRILRVLQADDFLTIHTFHSSTKQIFHGRVGNARIDVLERSLKHASWYYNKDNQGTALYDATVSSVGSVTSHAHGDNIARFLCVLSDGEDNVSATSSSTAKSALESCRVSNFYPILIAAGSPYCFSAMRASNATLISVGSTSDSDLAQAFQEVTDIVICKLQVEVRSRSGTTTRSTVTARGSRQEAHRNMTQYAGSLAKQLTSLRLEGGPSHAHRGKKPCKFYAQGRCTKGSDCTYAH